MDIFFTELNPRRLAELTGKISELSTHLRPVDKNIKEHIERKDEHSFISFQRNGSHICGGARVNYKHVLSVEACAELIEDDYNIISAVPLALNDLGCRSYRIKKPQLIEHTEYDISLVTVSSFKP